MVMSCATGTLFADLLVNYRFMEEASHLFRGFLMALPTDHPLRYTLNNEIHARPPQEVAAPEQISYLALTYPTNHSSTVGDAALDDLARICEMAGAPPPPQEANHFRAALGTLTLKWERHTEFVTYTFSRRAPFEEPFAKPPILQVPAQWLSSVAGQTLVGIHLAVRDQRLFVPDLREITPDFSDNYLVGASVGSGSAIVLTDLRIHEDGFGRILLMDTKMGKRQGGRIVQRLLEIETYRMTCLLALPVARETAQMVSGAEIELAAMTTALASTEVDDEPALLKQLTMLAAGVENQLAQTNFRFGAARAYYAIVKRRIGELREERLSGVQTIEEFMERRLAPAMSTCESAAQRLHDLSQRVSRASALLRTRVDIEREQQNQQLLSSMDRRAKIQLRLQQTVEGLSVAAITYYIVGLFGYVAKGLRVAGMAIQAEAAMAISIPFFAASVWYLLKRWRGKLVASAVS
jgi:uncharacterized membrane-anchored protein